MRSLRHIRALSLAAAMSAAAGVLVDCRKANVDVTPTELTIGNDQESVAIEISTSSPWTIEYQNTWVTASPASGNGSTTVYLTAVANNTGVTRETNLLVNAGVAEGMVTVPVKVVQHPMDFVFSVDTVFLPKDGGKAVFDVITDGPWSVMEDIEWVKGVEPASGIGNASITVTGEATDSRSCLYGQLVFKIGSLNTRLTVCLEPLENHSPEIPRLLQPDDGAEGLSVLPTFAWQCSDPDGDPLTYTLKVSSDRSSWSTFTMTKPAYTLEDPLDVNASYWWQVLADDGNGRDNSVSESEVRHFVTSGKTHYDDGEWLLIHEASVPQPVNLVFMGDGYVKEDCRMGGSFISDMKEGMEDLFSVEPYKGYEKYFNVYVVAAYSQQRGMSITGQQIRKTRFEVTKTADDHTALECNADTVFMYAEKIPAVKGALKKTAVFLMSNQNLYAGTCYIYSTGEAIAIIPVCRMTDPSVYTDYGSILLHEGGGHAFGHLADEYVTYEGHSLPQTGEWSVESVSLWQQAGFWYNISTSRETALMPWADLTGQEGYSAITNPQGGLYYEFGVWRSEKVSCMIDNMPYYSAAQRLSIVRHLKQLSGEEFSLEDFMIRDSVRAPSSVQMKSSSAAFRPLGTPVLREHR